MAAISEQATSVRVRKLEPWIVTTHARLAENEGVSLEEHLRKVLRKEALRPQEEFALEMQKRRAEIAEEFGTNFPSSVDLIRAVREASNL